MFEGKGRGFPTALGRIDVYQLEACYTRGARSRRWCGWWGRRERWGRGGGGNCRSGMDGSRKIMR